ncbi:Serpentine receptor class alpha-2 [Caenorhabditis elegans]|uniref:Serpentine receptor class alpha-2 n=1 Tax=Caenorhabditis elegans TaxID=6239 RepID=SRA2_CAEEL|nr:Serpentine receptor class alpha-2 [Caenorhabditis elegans]Q09204.1 RecName: Full=Serpentine receptor class alpha-2; Short=Protein sra-2 [Caenorhabditis elegans]CAA88084.1 Serpentine receptor class alpha-2 [Caenorhabditis elegans]prf//2123261B chemosensory receptor [Caenorhabditis elegans]|eukprot:NP_496044.1 Serpentine receptor class alpha-2 [Caenorhabditis elegans]
MSNSSCADEDLIIRFDSLNQKAAQFVYLLAIILTFITTYFAVKILFTQSFFEISTKILLVQNLFYANLYQFFHGIEAVRMLYKSFFMINDPCNFMEPEIECVFYYKIILMGSSGMVYGQTGLLIERLCATFSKDYKKKQSAIKCAVISILVLICSSSTGRLIVWDDPIDKYNFACYIPPKESYIRANHYFTMCAVLSTINFCISTFILKYNKRCEYQTRFKVGARFQKQELIESTKAICFLTVSQFVAVFLNSFGMIVLVYIQESISHRIFNLLVVWLYAFPIVVLMFPVILVHQIRSSRWRRALKIKVIKNEKQTQDDHMKHMKNMWI